MLTRITIWCLLLGVVSGQAAPRLQPADLHHVGAFLVPVGPDWEWAGRALTYRPDGDPEGADDGYPGSLFVVGHDHRLQVAEISIPAPVASADLDELHRATILQPFADLTAGRFGEQEMPTPGLAYLPPVGEGEPATLHFCRGQHFQWEVEPSHGWCVLDLSSPAPRGPWRLASYPNYVTSHYLFAVPAAWATEYAPGCRLATGRFREGCWGGLGPALFVYEPPLGETVPPPGETLTRVHPLLLYGKVVEGAPELETAPDMRMRLYQESDAWTGGAWIAGGSRAAVLLVGTKAQGRCWYGFANGVEYPMDPDATEFPEVPPWPNDNRGYWAESYTAMAIFYDPVELGEVAQGKRPPHGVQPYASVDLGSHFLGLAQLPRHRQRDLAGGVAYDRNHQLLFVVQRRADEDRPVVHIWRVGGPSSR